MRYAFQASAIRLLPFAKFMELLKTVTVNAGLYVFS